jgi:UDP-N-acetylmuramyl pentapeptide phosphotransferase/UDP-N-acetylglucosamine-1-phosphate transferase
MRFSFYFVLPNPMNLQYPMLQLKLHLQAYKPGLLCFTTAFVVAMLIMPPLIKIINRFRLFDMPNLRKAHQTPVPTMGGIAVYAGMIVALLLWYRFTGDVFTISFFFSLAALFALGIMDDLKDIPAHYKLAIQLGVALLMALSGVRVTSFEGLFGIYTLPLAVQYGFTLFAIVGITNAFNLIDGIDGLAGSLGFMSLISVALFLTLSGQTGPAIIAFALSGALLGFLYYNFNPARIFMGDTGSLVLGFTIAVLSILLIRTNTGMLQPVLTNVPVVALSVVLIPVFDTLRVFSLRISRGRSPFHPDKTHIHHLLTNNGWSHSFTSRLICCLHGFILMAGFLTHHMKPELSLLLMVVVMLAAVYGLKKLRLPVKKNNYNWIQLFQNAMLQKS